MSGRLKGAVLYTLGTAVVGVMVVAVGRVIAGREATGDLMGGTIVAAVVQVAVYWAFFVVALPGRDGLAHSLGVLVRLVAVAVMAFGGTAALGLAPGPALLSMVGCLFGSTLLEAVILQRRAVARPGAGAVTMR